MFVKENLDGKNVWILLFWIYWFYVEAKVCYEKNDKIFYKILVISIICDKCSSKRERIFKEEESFEALKITCVIKKPQALTLY